MKWDPDLYSKYEVLRTRPIKDLLKRVTKKDVYSILDLGCGTGNALPILQERWPEASITGVDKSVDMLAKAKAKSANVTLLADDIRTYQPERPVDLILCNAALHWLNDHDKVLPRLMNMLNPGGVLAIQIPNNWDEPSHTHLFHIAKTGPWANKLAPYLRERPVLEASEYHKILAPLTADLSVHESLYVHALKGPNPTLDWMKGTTLRPLIKALSDGEWLAFEREYGDALKKSYSSDGTGLTLFRFRRLMIVAEKPT